jgi:DNA-binding SARP family transcriptional activator
VDSLRVFLFGEFQIERDGEVLTDRYPRKLQELFCYLLLHHDRAHPRETLASLLWGNSSTARSKKYLRQALWQFQTTMTSCSESLTPRVLLVDSDMVRLNPDAELWLDVAVFEQALVHTQGSSGAALDAQQAQALCDAADLYRGDLLEGWYQDWCLFERERLQNMYFALLDALMDYCEAHDEYDAGLDYGVRALRHDQARERTHRRLMRLYYLAGDRTAALRQYECCVKALRRELAVKPAARTAILYEQIRTECFPSPAELPVIGPIAHQAPGSQWPEVIERLRVLQRALVEVQEELRRAIGAAESAMRG